MFLILPPIRSPPYTFFPVYKTLIFFHIFIPQKHAMPLFFKAWIPKENPFKTLGGLIPHKAYKYLFLVEWTYILFLILPPIRSPPYTFFPVYKTLFFFHIFIPQKHAMPLFFKEIMFNLVIVLRSQTISFISSPEQKAHSFQTYTRVVRKVLRLSVSQSHLYALQ